MKKSMIAIAALAAIASVPAMAEVSVYGTVDTAIRTVDNASGGSRSALASDGNAWNRLGFKGEEDLGNGLKASFVLEQGLQLDNGFSAASPAASTAAGVPAPESRIFGRRSTLSLTSAQYGELRLGRDLTPTYIGYRDFDTFGALGLGSLGNLVDVFGGASTKVRADNLISYLTPNLGGFTAQISAGNNENPQTGATGEKYSGVRMGYAAGKFAAQVAYGETEGAPVSGQNSTFAMTTAGGSYDFGFAKVMGGYVHTTYANTGDTSTYSLGTIVPMGNGEIRAQYAMADGLGNNDANVFSLGYAYSLSKRTALYTTMSVLTNDNGSKRSVASLNEASPANGQVSKGYEFGVRHSF